MAAETKKPRFGLLLIGAAIIPIGFGISWLLDKPDRDREECISNLIKIESAKEAWAMRKVDTLENPTMADLVKAGLLTEAPNCPDAGAYNVEDMSTRPSCSLGESKSHKLPTP